MQEAGKSVLGGACHPGTRGSAPCPLTLSSSTAVMSEQSGGQELFTGSGNDYCKGTTNAILGASQRGLVSNWMLQSVDLGPDPARSWVLR